ncbi:LamB/YcsF family protein [Algoriphagus sp. H41]|uniref:LamB/YcsF family protein n=1 Tax=Algoriphagus oliviformis TaxID=2811231 RepID=A0ABS3CBW8_9BACT|nr:LamB/YcsF family protein [Algoriphagus oliviformis]MBN7813129.1 LamB/YcsF family protein [Algoriphagus oliviformis]
MTKPSRYTINCDLGEGMPNEPQIIPLIDLGSVACGGHFGDRESLRRTLELLRNLGKRAGAHPSYPDRENFGRKSMAITPPDLLGHLADQLALFQALAKETGLLIDHIKFHGALYNDAAERPELAAVLLDFLEKEYPAIPLLLPPHSEMEKAARARKHPFCLELFGDRAYRDDYRLASRSEPKALFTQSQDVIEHLDAILLHGEIKTASGRLIPVQADTICFHGDNPGILDILLQVRKRYWT